MTVAGWNSGRPRSEATPPPATPTPQCGMPTAPQLALNADPCSSYGVVQVAGVKVKLDTFTDTGWPFVGAAP